MWYLMPASRSLLWGPCGVGRCPDAPEWDPWTFLPETTLSTSGLAPVIPKRLCPAPRLGSCFPNLSLGAPLHSPFWPCWNAALLGILCNSNISVEKLRPFTL